jgi:hypothetical protein
MKIKINEPMRSAYRYTRNQPLLHCVPLLLAVMTLIANVAAGQDTQATATTNGADHRIIVTDGQGIKHTLTEWSETRRFQNSGLPFSEDGVAIHPDYIKRSSGLASCIAVNFHTPKDQDKILQVAASRGRMENFTTLYQVILIVPMSSVDAIKFEKEPDTRFDSSKISRQISHVKIAGRPVFDAGVGYGFLTCKEDLGSLGQATFSSWVGDLQEIRAVGEPMKFQGDFNTFGCSATPFKVVITDTSGAVITLDRAVCCQEGTDTRERTDGYIGSVGWKSFTFNSELVMNKGETSHFSIAPAKIKRVEVGKSTGYELYEAKVTLRSGETFPDLAVSSEGAKGFLGTTPDGWIWVPWDDVSVVEFPEQ